MAGVPLYTTSVQPEWVDYNGHLRDAFYVLIASLATDALMDRVGLDAAYRSRTGGTLYTLELHVHYLREVKASDRVDVQPRIIALDGKRLHVLLELRRADDTLCAAIELLLLHVQQTAAGVGSAPLPAATTAALVALQAAAGAPPEAVPRSRRIELRRPAAGA